MFDRSRFNHSQFSIVSGGKPYFYATVFSQYATSVNPILVRVSIGEVTVSAETQVEVGNLGLYVSMPMLYFDAEYEVLPDMTAKVPLGTARMETVTEVYIILAAKMPLGRLGMASAFQADTFLSVKIPLLINVRGSEFDILPRMSVRVPIKPTRISAAFGVAGMLRAMQLLHPATVTSQFDISVRNVRSDESEEMTLEGLNLRPGQTLVIDTDTMEILVDDEVRVDCWVTGGSFFQFQNGSNILSFSDNAARRNLQVTVIWADRYL